MVKGLSGTNPTGDAWVCHGGGRQVVSSGMEEYAGSEGGRTAHVQTELRRVWEARGEKEEQREETGVAGI